MTLAAEQFDRSFTEFGESMEQRDLSGMPYALQVMNIAKFIGPWFRSENGDPVVIEHGKIKLLTVGAAQVRISQELMEAHVQFTRKTPVGTIKLEPIPKEIMDAVIHEYNAPLLKGIIHIPIFNEHWELISTEGYDPISEYYLDPQNIKIVDMTLEEAKAELEKLCIDMLFKDPVNDYANYIGYLLIPMIQTAVNRRMAPYQLFRKNQRGTGATTAVNVLGYIYDGIAVDSITSSKSDDAEIRKLMTTKLKEGCRYVNFDEQAGTIQSVPVTQYLTCEVWTDRILGGNKSYTVENPAMILIGTGNASMIGHDMARRVSLVEFFTELEKPETRIYKRAEKLESYVAANRSRIFSALCTLVKNWSKKPGANLIGDFNSVVETVSGILADAKIEGYQANRESIAVIDTNAMEQASFYETFYSLQSGFESGKQKLSAKQVADFINNGRLTGNIPALMFDKVTKAAKDGNLNVVSRWLNKMVGQNKNGYIMEASIEGHSKVNMFHVRKIEGGQ